MTHTLYTPPRRLPHDQRKANILKAAYQLAQADGYHTLTREAVATEAGVSRGLVTYYFLSIALLREAVMQAAIEAGNAEIVAAGLTARCPVAQTAPLDLRRAAAATLGI